MKEFTRYSNLYFLIVILLCSSQISANTEKLHALNSVSVDIGSGILVFEDSLQGYTIEDILNTEISWQTSAQDVFNRDQVSVINYESGQEVKRIDVGNHPQRIREGMLKAEWTSLY